MAKFAQVGLGRGVFAYAVLMLMGGLVMSTGVAVADVSVDEMRAHLQSGEFGPAMAVAAQAPNQAQRNQWLGEIARAQVAAGARRASAFTAADIANGRARSQAMQGISSTPIGGFLPRGGAQMADFETLVELIQSTVAPTSWEEVGGAGAIESFPGGVYVDPAGQLKKIVSLDANGQLAKLHAGARRVVLGGDIRRQSELRLVSLPRLEREMQLRWALGQQPDDTMRALAGLESIDFVLVYPEDGDIVLGGPAGDWRVNADGRWVSRQTGRPVLRLDDLVVLLRNAIDPEAGKFSCSIDPVQENLAQTKAFLAETASQPLRPGRQARDRWLREIGQRMGQQQVTVKGIDPRTRVARVIVEADYHMKLIAMGLEEGTLGVESYLDSIVVPPGGSPPPLEVLRWWFTVHYDAIAAIENGNAFQIRGQGVKVLSEKEMLTEQGGRIHTGNANALTAEFAHQFTQRFSQLADKYPIYAELQNIFDLALVSGLIHGEDLPARIGWEMTLFTDPAQYQVRLGRAPESVDTVINHRVINRKQIVAGASGGVQVNTLALVRSGAIQTGAHAELEYGHHRAAPGELGKRAWWWDAK